jgi:hypothetical protein
MLKKLLEIIFKPKVKIKKISKTLVFTDKEIKMINEGIAKHLSVTSSNAGDYIYNWYKKE